MFYDIFHQLSKHVLHDLQLQIGEITSSFLILHLWHVPIIYY